MNRLIKGSITAACILSMFFSMAVAGYASVNVNEIMELDYYSDSEVSDTEIAYRLYVPSDFDPDKEYALLLFLHGAGERGNDGNHLLYVEQYRYIQNIIDDEELKNEFVILAPQCPEDMRWVESDWTPGTYDLASTPQSEPSKLTMSLIEKQLFNDIKIDKSRIYVTGLSMGGFGVWDMLARYPDFFAAAVTMCGGCDVSTAEVVKNIPVRTFHAEDDNSVSIAGEKAMYEKLTELGAADAVFTVLNGCGHAAWNEGYSDTEVFNWLLSQRKVLPEPEPESSSDVEEEIGGIEDNIIWIIAGAVIAVVIVGVIIILNKKPKRRNAQ